MDIIKKVFFSPSKCKITDTQVCIDGASIDRDTEIPLDLSRNYTISQLCFYLMHSDLAYTEYLKRCKSEKVVQVSYIDQKKFIEEVKKYETADKSTNFDSKERHRCKGDYSFINKYLQKKTKYKIIIPNSYQSLLNIKNAKKFFEKGILEEATISLDEENQKADISDQFVVQNYVSKDWEKVAAVFLDGSKWQYRDWKFSSLFEISDNFSTFFLSNKENKGEYLRGFDITIINLNDKKVEKEVFNKMWNKIYSRIETK